MGVLDDAIKEHLELKRKHGVPEEELQRQEEEALGPARRDVAQQPEDDTELEPGQPVAADSEGDGALVATEPEEPAVVQDTAAVEDAPVAEHETPMPEHEPPVVEQDTALFDMEQDAAETEAEAASAPATEETQVPPAPVEASMPEETAVDEPTAIHEVVGVVDDGQRVALAGHFGEDVEQRVGTGAGRAHAQEPKSKSRGGFCSNQSRSCSGVS